MKCPMSPPSSYPELKDTAYRWCDCLEEECAWWDPSLGICAIRTIAGKLDDIDTVLGHIQARKSINVQLAK